MIENNFVDDIFAPCRPWMESAEYCHWMKDRYLFVISILILMIIESNFIHNPQIDLFFFFSHTSLSITYVFISAPIVMSFDFEMNFFVRLSLLRLIIGRLLRILIPQQ